MVTVFIPTTLINIISFATFFFKWFDFQNRVMVSLTTLLVLSTLFSQTSDSLPKTSYFKIIDIWFFSSIVFTFLTIITHTIVEYFHRYASNVDANPKSSVSSFIPNKVAPIGVGDEEFRIQQRELAFRERWGRSLPEMVDRIGFIVIMTLYLMFFVMFWGSSFTQKIKEDMKTIVSEVTEVADYPHEPAGS
ncbi:glycine receptor subunit alpha-3-like [Eriocheir sinensis]|uniref:glycine receptor subunit alpha-3-like n=1 Tax=Eriocheir sinensis TaxID=95602 RepID=UPI0021C5C09C|nr:glycine receptor subunit alpha-3-like [Eriocheir sinensis]